MCSKMQDERPSELVFEINEVKKKLRKSSMLPPISPLARTPMPQPSPTPHNTSKPANAPPNIRNTLFSQIREGSQLRKTGEIIISSPLPSSPKQANAPPLLARIGASFQLRETGKFPNSPPLPPPPPPTQVKLNQANARPNVRDDRLAQIRVGFQLRKTGKNSNSAPLPPLPPPLPPLPPQVKLNQANAPPNVRDDLFAQIRSGFQLRKTGKVLNSSSPAPPPPPSPPRQILNQPIAAPTNQNTHSATSVQQTNASEVKAHSLFAQIRAGIQLRKVNTTERYLTPPPTNDPLHAILKYRKSRVEISDD